MVVSYVLGQGVLNEGPLFDFGGNETTYRNRLQEDIGMKFQGANL